MLQIKYALAFLIYTGRSKRKHVARTGRGTAPTSSQCTEPTCQSHKPPLSKIKVKSADDWLLYQPSGERAEGMAGEVEGLSPVDGNVKIRMGVRKAGRTWGVLYDGIRRVITLWFFMFADGKR